LIRRFSNWRVKSQSPPNRGWPVIYQGDRNTAISPLTQEQWQRGYQPYGLGIKRELTVLGAHVVGNIHVA